MYLSAKNNNSLDAIIKNFEVSYRSLIAEWVISRYPTSIMFKDELEHLNSTFSKTSIIKSKSNKNKIDKLIREYTSVYDSITYSYNSYINQDYSSSDVPYVSEIVLLSHLFIDPHFINLTRDFRDIDQFYNFSLEYHRLRNKLSHPASEKILQEECNIVLYFIQKMMGRIEAKYFWYYSIKELERDIENFRTELSNDPVRIHNFEEIPQNRSRIVCRDKLINEIQLLLLGDGKSYRKSSSMVIYGYGGVGKSALIIEVIMRLAKEILDRKVPALDFILFFSNKEEQLVHQQSTGELYINKVRKQIPSYDEFCLRICEYLDLSKIEDIYDLKNKSGIIFIDNFETFTDHDKSAFLSLIRMSPRSIQYVVTSRNEEKCDDKIHLDGFFEHEDGVDFVDKYLENNDININLNHEQKINLLRSSKGNTLIIVLSLGRMGDGTMSFDSIIHELEIASSKNIAIIADFMYKNTLDQVIAELKKKSLNPEEIIRTMALYNEPVDIYSISRLTDISVSIVEEACNYLSRKLVVNKYDEMYMLNEFASKFVFIKLFPDQRKLKEVQSQISSYKSNLRRSLNKLEEECKKNKRLETIIHDWKPKNYVDKLAIAETYSIYGEIHKQKDKFTHHAVDIINEIKSKFIIHEKNSTHPYIRYQKARILQMLLGDVDKITRASLVDEIDSAFEEAIALIQIEYTYIANTKSYASLLWIYGIFINNDIKDISKAFRYIEDARLLFEKLKIDGKDYKKVIDQYFMISIAMYTETNDEAFLTDAQKCKKIINRDSVAGFKNWKFNNKYKKVMMEFTNSLVEIAN